MNNCLECDNVCGPNDGQDYPNCQQRHDLLRCASCGTLCADPVCQVCLKKLQEQPTGWVQVPGE